MGSANESASCLLFVNVHDLRLPYVVSIDFPQYKVEIEAWNYYFQVIDRHTQYIM